MLAKSHHEKFLLIHIINLKYHPILTKYQKENKIFKSNYNFNNFGEKKNILIIGNSYADDLLKVLSSDNRLNKKFYFYTPLGDDKISYDVSCFFSFLLEKQKNICRKRKFSNLKVEYNNADYIIFAEFLDYNYTDKRFIEILEILNKHNKKFMVFLDDLYGADILDNYIFRNHKLPDLNDLQDLEKKFFKKKTPYQKKLDINRLILEKLNVKYVNRSDVYCDFISKKCPLLVNEEKLYSDSGHITNYGARYFSNTSDKIVNMLTN